MTGLSKVERTLAAQFRASVEAKGACVYNRTTAECENPFYCDAHHVIKRQTLRNRGCEPYVQWDSRNGLPVCKWHHERLTNGTIKLTPNLLRPENEEFAYHFTLEHELAKEVVGYVPD